MLRKQQEQTKIIVIGAGIAGLSAACELAKIGYRVCVLEARSRPGGRIYTYRGYHEQVPIELGAQYWEGFSKNPLYQQYFHPPLNTTLFSIKNCYFSTNKSAELRYYAQAQALLQKKSPPTHQSYQQWLDDIALTPYPEDEQKNIRQWLYYQHKQHATPLTKIGWPSYQITKCNQLLEAWNDDDANFCFVKGGYDQLIGKLMVECQSLGVEIFFNQAVKKIKQQNNQTVTIDCEKISFSAQKIICTIPVGVLKTQHQQIFEPKLPALKTQALKTIGVHFAIRVVLIFNSPPFWQPINAPYLFIKTDDYMTFREFRSGYPLHGTTVLQTDSYADIALLLSKKYQDNKIINTLLQKRVLHDLKKHFFVPKLAKCLIRNWASDPFAQGAYVYRTVDMTQSLQTALEEPFLNVYFAGGDFSRCGFSVHNAYANGQLAAKRCHDELMKNILNLR